LHQYLSNWPRGVQGGSVQRWRSPMRRSATSCWSSRWADALKVTEGGCL